MSKQKMSTDQKLDSVRNVGIIAHIDAGKTTTTERFLFYSGKTHRIGEVDSGSTVMDYLSEEKERGITIVAAAAEFNWETNGKNGIIHLIDTPGHIDFTAEVERSLRVIDGAVVIFSGVEGVEAQSEKVWHQSDHYKVPKIAFINKLDRLGASFSRVQDEITEKFIEVKSCAVQIPIGIESDLSGIIDLMEMKALYFDGDDGFIVRREEIPMELKEIANLAKEELLLTVSDLSDPIAELYLDEKEIDNDLLEAEIRRLVISNQLVPVFAGSAKKDIGIQTLLDAINKFFPSPEDKNTYQGISPKTDEPIEIHVDDDSFCGLIFKIIAGESADLLYLRIYSGKLHLNDTLYNPRTHEKVRIKRLLRLYSKNIEAVDEAFTGDIVGLIGPSNIITGDTLCAVNHQVLLEKITFPEPVISMAVEPKSNKDRDRLDSALNLLCREDPTLNIRIHDATGQRLLSGMGELHLEINSHRIRDEFNLEVRFGVPQVAFRETIKNPVSVTGTLSKTIGDQELYAQVEMFLEPVPKLEAGIEIKSEIKKRAQIPTKWIESAQETLENGLKTGGNWGYPLIYIRGTIKHIDGTPLKTTENAVAGAVLDGLQNAILKGTVILEPLVKLDVIAPESSIGEISGYIQARRAVIHGIQPLAASKHLSCEVPLTEMFGFSKALPKLSGGRASFSMEPCGYQEISEEDLERLGNRDNQLMQ
jgi:elongation factor G